MSFTVDDGSTVVKDPLGILVYQFDWDALNLGAIVTITSSAFAATAIRPSTATVPTFDNTIILSGNRKTQTRITGGTLGAIYEIRNTIVTNEAPAQTKSKSFLLKIEKQ